MHIYIYILVYVHTLSASFRDIALVLSDSVLKNTTGKLVEMELETVAFTK